MTVDRELFKQMLRDKGLKVTNQRLLVLEALASCPDRHLTAEDIYEIVKSDYPEIGLATVYRSIQILLELQLIDRINLDDGYVRYEIGKAGCNASRHHHHHLICLSCGKIQSFEDDYLEQLENKIRETTGFCVMDHEVKLYGYCIECGGNLIEKI